MPFFDHSDLEPPEHSVGAGSVHCKGLPKPPSPISTESGEPTLKYQKFSIPSEWKLPTPCLPNPSPPSQGVNTPSLNYRNYALLMDYLKAHDHRDALDHYALLMEYSKAHHRDALDQGVSVGIWPTGNILPGGVGLPEGVGLPGGVGYGGLDDPEAEYFAQFAVAQFNKENNANLEFVRVLNVFSRVVAGRFYCITLEAKDESSGKVNKCVAEVWDIPWECRTSLEHFMLVESVCCSDGNLLWCNEQASTITFK